MEGWQSIFEMQFLSSRNANLSERRLLERWKLHKASEALTCTLIGDSDNTIPMDSSDSLTVSLTFDFIPHMKYNKAPPGVEPAALYCP